MSNIASVSLGSVTGVMAYVYQAWGEIAAAAVVPIDLIEKIFVAIVVAFIGGVAGYMGKKFAEWIIRRVKKSHKP